MENGRTGPVRGEGMVRLVPRQGRFVGFGRGYRTAKLSLAKTWDAGHLWAVMTKLFNQVHAGGGLVYATSFVLLAAFTPPLYAQCRDGTPPPCGVPVVSAAITSRVEPPSEDVRARSFLVLPFRNVRGLAEDDWLGESPLMLGQALSQWQEITVVTDERLYAAMRRHGIDPGEVADETQVRRVAEETGGWTAITGEILRVGGRIRVSARALDAATNEVVLRVRETAESEDDILEAYERIAAGLLEPVGLDPSAIDPADAPTESIDALKAYMRGVQHSYRYEVQQAREAFTEAISLDSTFALAYQKLAESWLLFTSMDVLSDATHPAYTHLTRAVALSGDLPERDRRLLRAVDAFFHGQFGNAREQLDALLASDSSDVDVLLILAWLESADGVTVTVDGEQRIRGSLNRANALAKKAVFLDPSRAEGYAILVKNYLTAGGWLWGFLATAPHESASLPAYVISALVNFAPHTPLLRDTIEILPRMVATGAYREERARAIGVARSWAERLLGAAPTVAEAHLWAMWTHEMAGAYDLALTELRIADSLGVETELEDLDGRRLVLYARAGRRGDALALADSLRGEGRLRIARPDPFQFEYSAAAIGLYMAEGRWDALAEIVDGTVGPIAQLVPQFAELIVDATCSAVPRALWLPALERVLMDVGRFPALHTTEQCLRGMYDQVIEQADSSERDRLVDIGFIAAESLTTDPGRYDLLQSLVVESVAEDSTERTLLRAVGLFKSVLAHDPSNLRALYQVGRIALFAGTELELAVRSFRHYLEQPQQPGAFSHAAAHWRLGMVYELQGNTDEAISEFEAAVKLDPTFVAAKDALERLTGGP